MAGGARGRQRWSLVLAAFALGCAVPLVVTALGGAGSGGERASVVPIETPDTGGSAVTPSAGVTSGAASEAMDEAAASVAASAHEPAASAPPVQRPVRTEPAGSESRYEEPSHAESSYEEPRHQEPRYQEPRYEESRPEEPRNPEPSGEVPRPAEREPGAGRAEMPGSAEPSAPEVPSADERTWAEPEFVDVVVPRGRILSVELVDALSSRTAQPGQSFDLRLAEPLYLPEGVSLPVGTRLTGRVLEAERARRPQKPGRLVLTAEAVQVEGGLVPVEATLSAHGDELRGRGSHEEDAQRIGIGAAAGAILGAILDGKEGALAGLVLGGGGVFLATRGEDVDLPAGTSLSAQLDRDVEFRVVAR